MCGITGILAFNDPAHPKLEKIKQATGALHLRGPDAEGFFAHHRCRLGHRRLSIIDISDAGSQPFQDASGRYTIVFNGEFFNFGEHRELLKRQGHAFRSGSDTEVLLELFVREGPACLNKVNGFFAFAVYDSLEESLFIARDRFGVKPLFIYQDEEVLVFASETKSLMAYGIPRVLNSRSLNAYFHLNYLPGAESILCNVRKLLPGHYVILKGHAVHEVQWYRIPDYRSSSDTPSIANAGKQLHDLLDQAVQQRLVSDVPLGAFLSGGIDSSAIVALASRHTRELNTFSIGFRDEPIFDETVYAEMVAKKFNTRHTVFSLSNDELLGCLMDVLNYLDEPFADSSALAMFILCRETRKHATVALSGDGADELFGGYNKHRGEYQIRHGGTKGALISSLAPLWKVLPQSRNSRAGNLIRKLAKFSEGRALTARERYWRWCGYADAAYLENLFVRSMGDWQEFEKLRNELTQFINETPDLNDVLRNDVHLVLPGDMLSKVDLMSMANSLEVRTPFLDYRVVEYAFSLSSTLKLNGKEGKLVLRQAFREILPEALFNRPKHGFEVPLLKWFRNELESWIFDELLNREFIVEQGLFNPDALDKLRVQLHSASPGDSTARLWALVVFQYWWKKWMI